MMTTIMIECPDRTHACQDAAAFPWKAAPDRVRAHSKGNTNRADGVLPKRTIHGSITNGILSLRIHYGR
jgi:hypothetical protein